MNGLERKLNPQNAADTARRQRREADVLKRREIVAGSLEEISRNLGDLYSGRFLALIDGAEPTDADATGAFVSAEGEVFDDLTVNIGTVKQGQPSAGFNTDGDFFWAGGAGSMDNNGLHLDGIRYALEHTATDTAGNNPRRGAIEMYYPDGEIAPAYRLIFGDAGTATELVTNGDFETGDLTGWTTSGAGSANVYSVHQSYYLNLISKTAQSTAFVVTAGTAYLVRAKVFYYALVRVDWYNRGGTLISSTTVANGSTYYTAWAELSANATAPAGAVTAKVYLSSASSAYFDNISVQARSVLTDLVFADDGIRGLWPEQWWGGWDAAQAFGSNGTRKTMVYLDVPTMWGGYLSYLSTDDATNGDYYTLKIPLAAGTYEWRMNYRSATDRGKVDLYVNGTKVSGATPFDMYAGTAAVNLGWTVSSIAIPKHGVHEFKVVVNGKHTSSNDYRVAASFITIRRTA